jgi:hypothetical protein
VSGFRSQVLESMLRRLDDLTFKAKSKGSTALPEKGS